MAGFGNNKMAVAFLKKGEMGDVFCVFLLLPLTS